MDLTTITLWVSIANGCGALALTILRIRARLRSRHATGERASAACGHQRERSSPREGRQ